VKSYLLNPKEMGALKVFINENLKEDKILSFKFPQAFLFFCP